MNTIVTQLEDKEFAALRAGHKSFIMHRSKVAPLPGQRLIMQCGPTDELDVRIQHVHDSPGLMKGYYLVSFDLPASPQLELEFDESKLGVSAVDMELIKTGQPGVIS